MKNSSRLKIKRKKEKLDIITAEVTITPVGNKKMAAFANANDPENMPVHVDEGTGQANYHHPDFIKAQEGRRNKFYLDLTFWLIKNSVVRVAKIDSELPALDNEEFLSSAKDSGLSIATDADIRFAWLWLYGWSEDYDFGDETQLSFEDFSEKVQKLSGLVTESGVKKK